MANKCIYCGSFDLKEEEDRSKPPVSFIPRPIYPKKYTCKKCRKTFTKEQMDNPSAVADGAESSSEASAPVESAPTHAGFASEPASGHAAKPASAGFSSESYHSPGFSSSPTPARTSGFSTLESDEAATQPPEKKSYMQIMKEKQQYQSQQFQDTVAAEQQAAKPAAKPAPKPAAKPAGVKPAGGPVMKPAGVKPPAAAPAAPVGDLPAELPELEALPDLPPLDSPPPEVPQPEPQTEQPSAVPDTSEPAAPVAVKPAGGPVMKPVGMKPAGMKPPVKPAGGPVMKPVGMKPPVKPAGGPVMKPAGIKPPAPSAFQSVEPPAPAPSAFQTMEAPAPKYVPPVIENEPIAAPAPSAPTSTPSTRLHQLLDALDKVLGNLSWPQEKKDMLKQELVNLPEGEQITFLEQLGVEIPPEHATPPTPAPVAPAPTQFTPAPVVPAPVAPAPVIPASVVPSMISPPMKPVVAMKPPVGMPGPGIVKPVGMKPPVSPPIKSPVATPGSPIVKPVGIKPPGRPPVAVPGSAVVKPAGIKPPTKPAATPAASAAAVGLFNTIDQEIEQTVAGEFDLDNFLDTGLELDLVVPSTPEPVVGMPKPPVTVPASIGEEENGAAKPAIKLSQISTKVEKKSEADLKREEERQKAQAATESSLVYMRLLAFEKACSIPKTFKIADFSKMLKDLDPQVLADFIVTVDNDFIIKYDDEKKQIIVSEISGPEMEILARQFEKWLRFGRL